MRRIAIDIDSTINMAHYYDIINGRELCKKYNYHPEERLNCINVRDMFSLDDKLYHEYMDTYFPWNCRRNIPAICAPESIRKLSRDFYIDIVTARDDKYPSSTYSGEQMKHDTINWFINNGIPVNEFHFASKDKSIVCEENSIPLIIEDDPKHILECHEKGIFVIIAAQSYNEHLIGLPRTHYSHNWAETMDMIYRLQKVIWGGGELIGKDSINTKWIHEFEYDIR